VWSGLHVVGAFADVTLTHEVFEGIAHAMNFGDAGRAHRNGQDDSGVAVEG
jgi:hypothetical protein